VGTCRPLVRLVDSDFCSSGSTRHGLSSELLVERVANAAALDALADEWSELHALIRPRLPFNTLRWLRLWWRHFSQRRALIRDEFLVHTLRDSRGMLVAVAPLMLTTRPSVGPFRSRRLAFFGSDRNVTELRGILCAPEREASAVESLLHHLYARKEEWDWFVWAGVRRDSPAYQVLSRTKCFSWTHELPDYVVTLPSTWQEFRASRSRNIKESLRKCYNSLKRDGHDFHFRAVTSADALPGALNRFFRLHSARATAPDLQPHADVFGSARAGSFLRDVASFPEQTPQPLVFELEIGGSVVASRLGFLLGDELYLYFSGYAPEWARYSVMTTLVAEAIKWAIEQQCRLVNLSPGKNVSKTRWGASTVTYAAGVLVSPTQRGRLTFGMLHELDNRSRGDTSFGRLLAVLRRDV
jgi:CelD/BcsL family acetyltransferase involved in cellulose biosynthesis